MEREGGRERREGDEKKKGRVETERRGIMVWYYIIYNNIFIFKHHTVLVVADD